MNKLDQTVLQVLTACVIVLAMLNDRIQAALGALFPGAHIAVPVGAFVLVYRLLVLLYDKLCWPIIHRENYIGGRWIYSLHNHVTGKQLYGVFVVHQGLGGTILREGAVWFTGGPPDNNNQRGSWHSRIAMVHNDELQFVFEMKTLVPETIAGAGKDVQGIMLLDLSRENGTPTLMTGHFYDHRERVGMTGSVVARRVVACTRRQQIARAQAIYGAAQQGNATAAASPRR